MSNDTIPSELSSIHDRLDENEVRFAALELALSENTEATKRVEVNTAFLVEILDAAQGAFKVLRWVGKLAKPVGYIATAIGAVWGVWLLIKGGGSPK